MNTFRNLNITHHETRHKSRQFAREIGLCGRGGRSTLLPELAGAGALWPLLAANYQLSRMYCLLLYNAHIFSVFLYFLPSYLFFCTSYVHKYRNKQFFKYIVCPYLTHPHTFSAIFSSKQFLCPDHMSILVAG